MTIAFFKGTGIVVVGASQTSLVAASSNEARLVFNAVLHNPTASTITVTFDIDGAELEVVEVEPAKSKNLRPFKVEANEIMSGTGDSSGAHFHAEYNQLTGADL